MKVAIPHWRGRVSPVFDVAGKVVVVEVDGGAERERREVQIDVDDPAARAAKLAETGADVLVCGAISRPLELALAAAGIEVIAQTCGEVETVLSAFIGGRLGGDTFLMPGCPGRRRRFQGGRGRGQRVAAAGPDGLCVCPGCGRQTPHAAGVPCNRTACPTCGTRMIRGR